jgi:ATP-dependent RNA helicase DeaD
MTTDFNGFGLPAKLLQSLVRMQFNEPTPIQMLAIPLAMTGRDILGSAQTGTGKTGAFGIPLIAKLMESEKVTALILTPTRELAAQVIAALQQMVPVQTIRTALLIGGEPMPKQFRQLQAHPRLVVGTPGRINDHLQRGTLKLNHCRFLVLDETDRMLDMGFGPQLEKIAQHLQAERQTMMFSATMPPGIIKMAQKYLINPERISAGSTTQAAPNIAQELIQVSEAEKFPRLQDVLKGRTGSILIFVKTKYGTEKLAEKLSRMDLRAEAMHGDLRQSRRDRVIQNFRDKKFQILVATDLAARGLDVPHIELVINYDLPQCPEDYIHRVGRTARAGASGKAINLLTGADGIKWRAIRRLMDPAADQGKLSVMSHQENHAPHKYHGGGAGKNANPKWRKRFASAGKREGGRNGPRPAGNRNGQQKHAA